MCNSVPTDRPHDQTYFHIILHGRITLVRVMMTRLSCDHGVCRPHRKGWNALTGCLSVLSEMMSGCAQCGLRRAAGCDGGGGAGHLPACTAQQSPWSSGTPGEAHIEGPGQTGNHGRGEGPCGVLRSPEQLIDAGEPAATVCTKRFLHQAGAAAAKGRTQIDTLHAVRPIQEGNCNCYGKMICSSDIPHTL